ncbi:26376_t:CDS:2 [Gigaspora margarita]|uniref:26376_t:CDS:1 n=1 Tax=Gigaspora margarita TaxID=4874 RepID=A0ABN7UZJ4_GIGMA|nr:26376_t:CDS:2 [Gigaspora margarita]
MYEDNNIFGNEKILSSDCEGDPIDKSIEGPVELLIISTCKVWKSISVTKEVILQEDNKKQYPVELIYQPWWLSALKIYPCLTLLNSIIIPTNIYVIVFDGRLKMEPTEYIQLKLYLETA